MGKVESNHEFCLLIYPIPFGANLPSSDWPVWHFDLKGPVWHFDSKGLLCEIGIQVGCTKP